MCQPQELEMSGMISHRTDLCGATPTMKVKVSIRRPMIVQLTE